MDELITLKEFGKMLHKSEETVRTWKRRGDLPDYLFKTIGRAIYIKTKEISRWVDDKA